MAQAVPHIKRQNGGQSLRLKRKSREVLPPLQRRVVNPAYTKLGGESGFLVKHKVELDRGNLEGREGGSKDKMKESKKITHPDFVERAEEGEDGREGCS